MSIERKEFVLLREGQWLKSAYESEPHQRPRERSIGEACEDGAGHVGVCLTCGAVAVIGHAMHVCRECFEDAGDTSPLPSPQSGEGEESGGAK